LRLFGKLFLLPFEDRWSVSDCNGREPIHIVQDTLIGDKGNLYDCGGHRREYVDSDLMVKERITAR
jgi:hypothetical protein